MARSNPERLHMIYAERGGFSQHTPADKKERGQSGGQAMHRGANSTICVGCASRIDVDLSERDEAINTNCKSVEICLCAFTRWTFTGL